MNRFFQRNRLSLFLFRHLFYQQPHGFIGKLIDLLSDGADGKDSLAGYGGIVKTNQKIILGQGSIFSYQQIQQHIGKGVTGDKYAFLLFWILYFQIIKDRLYLRQGPLIIAPKLDTFSITFSL